MGGEDMNNLALAGIVLVGIVAAGLVGLGVAVGWLIWG